MPEPDEINESRYPVDFEHIIRRYFLGGIRAGSVLVKKSEVGFLGDADQLSLNYRGVLNDLGDIGINKRYVQHKIFDSLEYFLTFTKNDEGLYVDERPGIIYGGRVRPLWSSETLTHDISLAQDIMAMIDELPLGSEGRDLHRIGEFLRAQEEQKDLEAGIMEKMNTRWN